MLKQHIIFAEIVIPLTFCWLLLVTLKYSQYLVVYVPYGLLRSFFGSPLLNPALPLISAHWRVSCGAGLYLMTVS